MIGRILAGVALGTVAVALATPSLAQTSTPFSVRNSFRVGTSGVACTAQNAPSDPRVKGMFDRAYRLSCRDAAGAVGNVIAVRRSIALVAEPRGPGVPDLACGEVGRTDLSGVGTVETVTCRDGKANVDYRRYVVERGGTSYLVEGLAGYDPALRLALASVVNDAPQPGEIRVASTEVSDPAAFARVQAGLLEADDAVEEGYTRNNGGRFAESAEFFDAAANRNRDNPARLAEALANQGLQLSNLGNFDGARRVFEEATGQVARGDGVTQRLLRNYRAIDLLNQGRSRDALEVLNEPVATVLETPEESSLRQGLISSSLSDQINRENVGLQRLGGLDPGLTPVERAEVLDGQSLMLAGIAHRQVGDLAEATVLLNDAAKKIDSVRDGRVVSTGFLRSEIQMELALIAEAEGRRDEAVGAFDSAIAAIGASYPNSPALLAARARKAAFLGRGGDVAGARSIYEDVVEEAPSIPDVGPTLRSLLSPYFSLLAKAGDSDAAAAMFSASQVLERPGVAQTQAILARQLSDGNDEAASLFRLAIRRSREIARQEVEIGRMQGIDEPTPQDIENLRIAESSLATMKQEQAALTSQLSAFPRYKALAPEALEIADLQKELRAGEGYYKLIVVGDDLYGLFTTASGARVIPVPGKVRDLEKEVQVIRDSVVTVQGGQTINFPFDLVAARKLYLKLFEPIDSEIKGLDHLIFEPDGPMLQLPPYILVTEDRGVTAYQERMKKPKADEFDFTGVDWLGRGRKVSIAVSPRGFLDIRALQPSNAPRNYLGLGNNAPVQARPIGAVATECDWPLAVWDRPIAPDELFFAQSRLQGGASEVRVGEQFTDSALLSDQTLDQYKIVHFATHGLVSAPRRGCPARPALVTSFGDSGSDGLLSFREIFDLKLDADLVILSACDTAGMATVSASRDAGVTTGGNYALDGLVRAFVGAGARTVLASHWPVPDDFDATKRLVSGLLDAGSEVPLAKALATAQESLMDDVDTSHPFYWAAFVIVGDGAKPIVTGK
ncbi:CHAT domain protein [Tsuneonella dongtanensis]|uniref:CHAT domain protein n=1 Tax=Tsuneonella dongtanensis TaxID=692370 RepID=A0A1B2AG22_9SPHN|nr:CHAT domain-containing protein [Tsuneonella dongtanensis]ANY21071.1 CHAT domain protein [Tsuneonella dongtanensis]